MERNLNLKGIRIQLRETLELLRAVHRLGELLVSPPLEPASPFIGIPHWTGGRERCSRSLFAARLRMAAIRALGTG